MVVVITYGCDQFLVGVVCVLEVIFEKLAPMSIVALFFMAMDLIYWTL